MYNATYVDKRFIGDPKTGISRDGEAQRANNLIIIYTLYACVYSTEERNITR